MEYANDQQERSCASGAESGSFPNVLSKYMVPRDVQDPRYVVAFSVDQSQEIKDFFEKFGFVVVKDVLTSEDCTDTVNDMYRFLESEGRFKRDDITTWNNWPREGMVKHGMPTRPPVFTKPALRNRQNPNIFKVFSTLLGTEDLLVNHDRYGFLRPTRDVKFPYSNVCDMPQWKTVTNIHLDMDPWGYMKDSKKVDQTLANLKYDLDHLNHFIFENNQISHHIHPLNLQGVINLLDNYEEDGGFIIVPGFKHHFEEWSNIYEPLYRTTAQERNSLPFPEKDPLQSFYIRVPMRAGSLVVWDQRSPHGAKANDSSRIRCAQFIKMFPANPINQNRLKARSDTIRYLLRKAQFEGELTPLGARLFGLEVSEKKEQEKRDKPRKSRIQGGWSK